MTTSLITLAADPIDHVLNRSVFGVPALMHVITMIVALLLTIVVLQTAARRIATGPESEGNERFITKGRFAQLIEVIVVYLRDQVIYPQLGKDTNRFLPYLLTLFFFILFNNILGLIPLLDLQHLIGSFWGDPHFAIIGGTATGNIAVTGALAIVAFLVIQISGIRASGPGKWFMHHTGGAPWYIWPIMIPIEFAGDIIKPAALAIRLFANMVAGHVLLAVLLGFTAVLTKNIWVGAPVTLISIVASVAIFFLELFVAFLQAFIFMFLTTIFVAQFRHHHEEHDDHQAIADHAQRVDLPGALQAVPHH